MIKKIITCIIIAINAGQGFGQQATSVANQSSYQRAEFALQQLPDQIKRMDEPALRVFLRIRLATFLWSAKTDSAPASITAEAIVTEAVKDIQAHADEIPAMYASRFRADVIALLQQRAPDLLKRLAEKYEFLASNNPDQLYGAQLLLDDKAGAASAVEMARRILSSGQDPGSSLIFLLQRLQQEKPSEIPGLLSTLLVAEEQRPDTISINTFFWLASHYLKEENPQNIRTRFLAAAISAVERNQSWGDSQSMLVYRLLNNIAPVILKLAPSLYARSRALSSAAATRLPQSSLDRIAAENRISQSADRLAQLLTEAHATKDASFRDDLLSQAAQLALAKKQFKVAADLAGQTSSEGGHGIWRDQFLADVARGALDQKDPSLAEEIATKIKSDFDRAATLQKIALYFFAASDIAYARAVLNDAAKLIESADNSAQKARHLLLLTTAFLKVDTVRAPEITQAAINAINSILKPPPEEKPGSEKQKAYAQSLMILAWNTIPAFRELVLSDELGTFNLANGIQSQEIRAAAIFAASVGILQASKGADVKALDN